MVVKEKNMMDKEPVLGHGNKILALWTAPRSRSTAFERMMMERGDFHTIHDPFGPHYYHQTRHMRPVEVDPTREVRFERIVENLQQATQSQPRQVFIKDFPWHFLPYADVDETFLSLFTHTFLIRHPAQMIASYLAGWPDALESELGYPELAEMFDRVKAYQGSVPIVVDADDLVNAPAATIQAYCDALQIPFLPNALSWQPGERKEFIYMEGGRWHGNLNQSGGFQSFENKTYPTMESSPRLRELVAAMMPYYEKLHAVKL